MPNHKHDPKAGSANKQGETPNGTGGLAKQTATKGTNTKVGEAPSVIEGPPNAPAGEAPQRDVSHDEKPGK